MAESHFWQALSDTIHRSVNLRIVTLVGDAQVQGTLEGSAGERTSRGIRRTGDGHQSRRR